MRGPTVSVIIPTYNRAHLLLQALESVFRQTYAAHEILVVDDGSTDGTRRALDPHMGRIRYLLQENAGQSAAINRGAAEARGAWLAFLHSDDAWLPERLARMVEYLDRHPHVRVLSTAARLMTGAGRPTGRIISKRSTGETLSTIELLTRHKGLINGAGVLIDRACFLGVGGFDESLRSAEDCDLWLRLSRHATIAMLNEPLLLCRKHPDNTSANILLDSECWLSILAKLARENPDLVRRHPWAYRRALAKQHIRRGRELLVRAREGAGNLRDARAELGRSIRQNPLSPRAYLYWLATRTMPSFYARLRRWEIGRRRY
jgi:glycosyltransferase involved in cell wall biosynthesis